MISHVMLFLLSMGKHVLFITFSEIKSDKILKNQCVTVNSVHICSIMTNFGDWKHLIICGFNYLQAIAHSSYQDYAMTLQNLRAGPDSYISLTLI